MLMMPPKFLKLQHRLSKVSPRLFGWLQFLPQNHVTFQSRNLLSASSRIYYPPHILYTWSIWKISLFFFLIHTMIFTEDLLAYMKQVNEWLKNKLKTP